MSSKTEMNLRHLIDTFRILNMSDEESTIIEERFPFQNSFKKDCYIVSDVDEELLLLIEFHNVVDLHSIKIHALPQSENNNDDHDDDENKEDMSPGKAMQIFRIEDLSKDFNDLHEMKATHSLDLKSKKLAKGQSINLQKKSKIAIKFKKIRYLAVLIKSNQNNTEKSYINGIILSGKSDAKLEYDIPYTENTSKKKQKSGEIIAMFDKLDKKNVGLAQLLKTNQSVLEFNISNDLIHSLLSYISRLPIKINTNILHKIYENENNFGEQWIKNTIKSFDDNKEEKIYKIETQILYKDTIHTNNINYDEKMSFALMKILCIEDVPKEIKLFLNKKIEFIIFHCMLIFHPSSNGNLYHAVEILKILLQYYPLKLYEILTRSNYIVIQQLFKYALISRIHEAKFGEFLLKLLLYNEARDQQSVVKFRGEWINILRSWAFLESITEIGTNPHIYGVDISNKYCDVIVTLLKQCATMNETAPLFFDSNRNILSLIINSFINGGLDKQNNDKWYRINCIKMIYQITNDLSDTKVVEKNRKKIIKSCENHLYSLFNDGLKTLSKYIPLIVDEIILIDSKDVIYNTKIRNPLGIFRLKCFELLILYIEISLKRKIKFNGLGITNINILCKGLIDMTFIHINNNLFLVKFRDFINILNKHCVNYLKYMIIECIMVDRFIQYYNNNTIPSALKSFILTILWDLNNNVNKANKWSFVDYVKSNNNAKQFMIVVEKQMKLQKPTKAKLCSQHLSLLQKIGFL
eukprot:165783_1